MALSVVKASPCMIMMAVRAIGSTKGIKINAPSFSSVAAASKDCVDAALNKALECEINSPKYSNLQKVKTPTDSFPFKIEYLDDGKRKLRLEREFPDDGEEVFVTINTKESTADAISMTVEVYKASRVGHLCFQITVSSSNDNIIIHSVKTNQLKKYIYSSYIDGTRLGKMDYELQRCLSKYLEIRGITSNIASFLLKTECISENQCQGS